MLRQVVEKGCALDPLKRARRDARREVARGYSVAGTLRGGLIAALLLSIALLTVPAATAATITKADNATALNDTASWVGGAVPGSGDVALWDSTVTSANSVALGGDLEWQGIQVVDPAGNVTITSGNTLSLGSDGIDLSTATADLTIEAGIALTATQAWQAAAGRTITLAGDISGTGDVTIGSTASVTSNTFLTTTAQPLFTNETLSNLVATSGVMSGAYVGGGGASIPGLGYLLSSDGSTANYWLEILDGGFTKGLQIELAQSGSDITARAVNAKYVSGSQLGFDFNTGGSQGTVATSPTAAGYGGQSTTLTFASGTATGTTRITGNPTYTGVTLIATGTLDLASTADVTLAGPVLGPGDLVKSGSGKATLAAAGSLTGSVTITGGILALGVNDAAGTAVLTLDGGTLERNVANSVVPNDIAVAAGGGTLFGRQTVDDYTNFTGSLTGSGALTADGLVQLSGSGSYAGTITVVDTGSYFRFKG